MKDTTRPTIKEFNEIYEFELPTKKVVCPNCVGMRKPADPECETCHGENVVDHVLLDLVTDDVRAKWFDYCAGIIRSNAHAKAASKKGK